MMPRTRKTWQRIITAAAKLTAEHGIEMPENLQLVSGDLMTRRIRRLEALADLMEELAGRPPLSFAPPLWSDELEEALLRVDRIGPATVAQIREQFTRIAEGDESLHI